MKRNEKNEKQMAVLPMKAGTTHPSCPTPFVCMFALPTYTASLVHAVHFKLSLLPLPWFVFSGPHSHCPPLVHICTRVDSTTLVCTCSQCVGRSAAPQSMLVCACVPSFIPHSQCFGLVLCPCLSACAFMWAGLPFVCAWCGLSAIIHARSWYFGLFRPLSTLVHVCMWIGPPAFIHTRCVALVHAPCPGCFGLICP